MQVLRSPFISVEAEQNHRKKIDNQERIEYLLNCIITAQSLYVLIHFNKPKVYIPLS